MNHAKKYSILASEKIRFLEEIVFLNGIIFFAFHLNERIFIINHVIHCVCSKINLGFQTTIQVCKIY
ncbi:hypothetical protein BGP_5450 [Beggiatoa sp. PS]|nr:hypothetical protein BGP_5450 [Beggiatoa sp. PS]